MGNEFLSIKDDTMKHKIFLGGTCNKTTWREELIPHLNHDFFNPVVEDWTPECIEVENREKEICDIHLYVITPEMTGMYSIAEAVQSSNTPGVTTIFYIQREGFTESQLRSLDAVSELIVKNKAVIFEKSVENMKALSDSIDNVIERLLKPLYR